MSSGEEGRGSLLFIDPWSLNLEPSFLRVSVVFSHFAIFLRNVMALADYLAELDLLAHKATAAFAAAGDAAALEEARIEYLAKNGRIKAVQKGLGSVDKSDRPAAGKRFNEVKQAIEAAYELAGRAAGQGVARRPMPGSSTPRPAHDSGWPAAPDDADDRGAEGDHGPAGVYRGRGARGGRPLAQF